MTWDNGFFILEFRNEETMEAILHGGQCYLGGKLIIHKKLYPDMQLTKQDFFSAPDCLFVLNNGSVEMWKEKGPRL